MPGDLSRAIGLRVKALRAARGLSMAMLGDLIGHGSSRISDLENGKSTVSADHIEAIARALKVRPGDLLPATDLPLVGIEPLPGEDRVIRAIRKRDAGEIMASLAAILNRHDVAAAGAPP